MNILIGLEHIYDHAFGITSAEKFQRRKRKLDTSDEAIARRKKKKAQKKARKKNRR